MLLNLKKIIFIFILIFSTIIYAVNPLNHTNEFVHRYLIKHPINSSQIEQTQKEALQNINKMIINTAPETIAARISNTRPNQSVLPSIYPINSNLLNPGIVKARPVNLILPNSIFIGLRMLLLFNQLI